ncbi:hypothetical protein A6764_01725 [Brevibacillus sp. WF146]|uniref:hypothetical protein n=1 Tax=Brevibacillus sp. WF146 TaxID=319501 RepID=UPI0007EDCFD9|nr:hypothetical protein [Brevibacillus sp. WF146]UYZ13732.1 hypothetical protein A6764_01725 [Brevibacillus sp. WF146]
MKVSSYWNKKVQQHPQGCIKYRTLFEQKTELRESPIDGIMLFFEGPVTPEFFALLNEFGIHHKYCDKKSMYDHVFSLGPVRVFQGPRFSKIPQVMIKINPSNAGLTLEQISHWLRLICGDEQNAMVYRVDYKVDLLGCDTSECINSFWCSGFRKFDDSRYTGETLYMGSRRGKRQRVVYNKTKESKLPFVLTRIEVRERFKKGQRLTFNDFCSTMITYNPFEGAYLVNVNSPDFQFCLKKFGKSLIENSVIKTLKSLSPYQRRALVKVIESDYRNNNIALVYQDQLNKWLNHENQMRSISSRKRGYA